MEVNRDHASSCDVYFKLGPEMLVCSCAVAKLYWLKLKAQALQIAVDRALDAYGRRGVSLKDVTLKAQAEFDALPEVQAEKSVGKKMQMLGIWTREHHQKIRGDLEDAVEAVKPLLKK